MRTEQLLKLFAIAGSLMLTACSAQAVDNRPLAEESSEEEYLVVASNEGEAGEIGSDEIAFEAESFDDELELVSNSELDENRGAFDPTLLNLSDLNASSENNVITGNVTTGTNSLDPSALVNVQGVVGLIQNSGNNVIIQSVTNINVTMTP